jgi:N-methylhydantoinase A
MRRLRVGVDVGGTFTDAVAIEASSRALVASAKVPTTHRASTGIAEGIARALSLLLERAEIAGTDVAFIAHSTTQATNALLEGDLACVGIVGLLDHFNPLARHAMTIPEFEVAAGVRFAPRTIFAPARDDEAIAAAIERLIGQGAKAVVATRAFGVDRIEGEDRAAEYARKRGVFATGAHDVGAAYGLRARTRTAALNAAILPAMIQTTRTTADAVAKAKIAAPLMVMRSDAGVMDVREVQRRPIQTLLSGPAAGVAGALLYEQISDGIFVEVGGTSSDCSAIRGGRPQMRVAVIGGHRMMLRTLDVRTFGIAGGSLLKIGARGVVDVGPRSAHIAGCEYASFVPPELLDGARVESTAPAVLVTRDGKRVALTPTCAANLLGYVPDDAFARGDARSALAGFEVVARSLGFDAQTLARQTLDIACAKLVPCVRALIRDYALDANALALVGGGGGAAALIPYLAQLLRLPHRIAKDAEVISPIGVALALLRDSVERTIVDPTPEEIARLRREAADRVIRAGAAPERVEVDVEIDTQRNMVRATASGAADLSDATAEVVDERTSRERAARSLHRQSESLSRKQLTPALTAYASDGDVRVLDERGVIRLSLTRAALVSARCGDLEPALRDAIESATSFGDIGRALPELYLLHGARIANFTGMANAQQAIALAKEEVTGRNADDPVAILTVAVTA